MRKQLLPAPLPSEESGRGEEATVYVVLYVLGGSPIMVDLICWNDSDTCTLISPYIHAVITLSIDIIMLLHSRYFQEISLPPRTATPTTQTTSWLAQSLSVEAPTRLSLRGVWRVDVSTLCLVW